LSVPDVVRILERELGRKAQCELVPMQPGDVPETCADVSDLEQAVGFRPATPIEEGVRRFVAWYRDYHGTRTADDSKVAP
jgi:UDP-glucuronate 4-epimerase